MALYLLKTDTVWGVAGIHGAWNFAQGNLFGILVSGQPSGTSLMTFFTTRQSRLAIRWFFWHRRFHYDKSGITTADCLSC